jgi:hypothetical protein
MSHFKQIQLLLLAILAIGMLGVSASAQATPTWWVEGKALAASETEAIAETTNVLKAFVIKTPKLAIECTTVALEKSLVEGTKARTDQSMIIGGCKLVGVSGCTVAAIKSKPLSSVLEGTTGKLKLNFKPTSGTEVATVSISGTGCPGSFVLTGTMACEYPGVETESVDHILDFSVESGSKLLVGEEKVVFSGEDEFWLELNLKWSALP